MNMIWQGCLAVRYLRNRICTWAWKACGVSMGSGSLICYPARINTPKSVVLGRDVFLAGGSSISAIGGLVIEDGVMAGPNLVISGGNHSLAPSERRISRAELNPPLRISRNVWLGANVTILAGASVGANSVIGAGSVVTRPVPPGVVAFGVPCRVRSDVEDLNRGRPECRPS